MKVIIIEDEALAVQRLTRLLLDFDSGIEILAVLESVEKTINWLETNTHPDLMFVDVQLEDGLCFEIFETIHIDVPVLFTTAYDEFALKAFKLNSVDYLLKPINAIELKNALQKFISFFSGQKQNIRFDTSVNERTGIKKERFLVKIGNKFRSIPTHTILCFYISDRNTFLMTLNGKNYGIDYSLDKLEQILDTNDYFRINRTLIVSYDSIREMVIYSSSRLKLILKEPIVLKDVMVSRERVPDFKQWMDR